MDAVDFRIEVVRQVDGEWRIERGGVVYSAPDMGALRLTRFAAHNDFHVAIVTEQGEIMMWRTTGKYVGAVSTFSAGPVEFTALGRRLVHGDRVGAANRVALPVSDDVVEVWDAVGRRPAG